jgi:hypothetical protein
MASLSGGIDVWGRTKKNNLIEDLSCLNFTISRVGNGPALEIAAPKNLRHEVR